MQLRILAAAGLLCAAPALHAYQIVEGKYRVETAPGVFEDQLVVRCDDGRTLTVSWDTKLAEICGEGLMGERVGKSGKAVPAPAGARSDAAAAEAPAAQATATPAPPAPVSLFDDAGQREAMLAQFRAQFGPVPDRYIEFKPGPDGLSMRLLPPLNEIVRKYETCRRAREPGAQCGAVRDQAIAKLSDTDTPALADAPAVAPRTKSGKSAAAKPAAKADAPDPKAENPAAAADAAMGAPEPAAKAPAEIGAATAKTDTPAAPDAAAPGPAAEVKAATPAPKPMDRAAREQRIAEDHAVCMRLKPRFECEQARARALGALDKPKAGKPAKQPAKHAKGASAQVAAAPAQ